MAQPTFRRPHSVVCLVLPALGMLTPLPAMAQVHRWVDERGVVQYGDRPPAAGATTLRLNTVQPSTTPGALAASRTAGGAASAATTGAPRAHSAGGGASPTSGAVAPARQPQPASRAGAKDGAEERGSALQ